MSNINWLLPQIFIWPKLPWIHSFGRFFCSESPSVHHGKTWRWRIYSSPFWSTIAHFPQKHVIARTSQGTQYSITQGFTKNMHAFTLCELKLRPYRAAALQNTVFYQKYALCLVRDGLKSCKKKELAPIYKDDFACDSYSHPSTYYNMLLSLIHCWISGPRDQGRGYLQTNVNIY